MKCQYCKSVCVKAGKQKNGTQKFRCKSCKKGQQENYIYHACILMKRELISTLIINNTGVRGIARSLKVSPTTVMKTVLTDSHKLNAPALATNGVYEVDEMQSYKGNKKNKIFVVYGIERKTGAKTEIAIGKRTKQTLRKVINAILLSRPKRIYTDGNPSYASLIPKEIHRVSKFMLSKIERLHLSVRNALKRFNRKTIGFPRSIEMTIACLKLFLWASL